MAGPLDAPEADVTRIHPPASVLAVLETLWSAGHAAFVVGGSVRDALDGRQPADWDLATDARPERLLELFPGSVATSPFGTVAIRVGEEVHEATTFRVDHDYADHRRPHHVEFGDRIELDLGRRDFTINAMAWGAGAPPERDGARPVARLVDPHGGAADLRSRTLRAVGDPRTRFEEDSLRMIRAVRFAATLDLAVEARTLAAMVACHELVAHLSAERVWAELERLLVARRPSVGLRLMAATGILGTLVPELDAERGIPQNKVPGEDLWGHTLRTVDAAPAGSLLVRLAAVLHDVGKPVTMADDHFFGHDAVGAELAAGILERLRVPHALALRVVHLVRQHMFTYDPGWGDAGVRRFIRRIGRADLEPLFELRQADNVGSGEPADAHGLAELRARVHSQLAGPVVLERGDLAIDGDDLISELGFEEGPELGRLIEQLLDRAIVEPSVNDRAILLRLARDLKKDGLT